MPEEEKPINLLTLPTEILLHIFTLLPAKELITSRQICFKWKSIVDGLVLSEVLWRKYCSRDYSQCYLEAGHKTRQRLSWYQIYRSLSLWCKIEYANEIIDEFSNASNADEKIRDCKILADGQIVVIKAVGIYFYDITTLTPSSRQPLHVNCVAYSENNNAIAILDPHKLSITRKLLPRNDPNLTCNQVVAFILIDKEVYYASINNEIYVCKLEEYVLKSNFIGCTVEPVMAFSHNKTITILTYGKKVYSIQNNKIVLVTSLECVPNLNLMDCLNEYKLLDCMDWSVYYEWALTLRQPLPQGPLRQILIVKTYGDMVFLGCNLGVLLIYHFPYRDGVLDLLNSTPIKQYNFAVTSHYCPVLTECPIQQIDVLELEDGHIIVVAMPKKVGIIYFYHNPKHNAAIIPYNNIRIN